MQGRIKDTQVKNRKQMKNKTTLWQSVSLFNCFRVGNSRVGESQVAGVDAGFDLLTIMGNSLSKRLE